MIDQTLQKYYEDRLSMMSSQGWKDLMDDLETMKSSTDTLSGITPENVRFKQGELSIINWLLNIQDTSEAAYEELKNG
jgi:hypothetical protein